MLTIYFNFKLLFCIVSPISGIFDDFDNRKRQKRLRLTIKRGLLRVGFVKIYTIPYALPVIIVNYKLYIKLTLYIIQMFL